MSRSLVGRAVALALSLSLFLGESELIVRCPAHGGGDSTLAASAAHDAAGANAAHHHAAGQPAPADQGGTHTCSCPGPGCCPPAVAVLPSDIIPLAHVVAVHEAAAVSTLDRLASGRDHVLPFATAPPAPALAPAAA